ncbi:MAG TPA: EAL domain-containing protein [Caulobacterales bacterium]|nr:EAL domain-containing protein [Caulobacterales bacterium]
MSAKEWSIRAFERRPLGLGARASLFAVGLLIATAAISTVAVMIGFENESRRHQEAGGREVAERVAHYAGQALERGDIAGVGANVARMASRSEVQRVVVTDPSGAEIAGQGAAPDRQELGLVSRAAQSRAPVLGRTRADGLLMAEPIVANRQLLGVAAITIKPEGFRYNTLLALTPFFLALGCFMLFAIPAVVVIVRRALRPLEVLTEFAKRMGERGEAEPVKLRTGDEFEVLANAFNQMIARLQASMKKIQQIAFVDPVTQLPNQDRFQRELNFAILQAEQNEVIAVALVFEFQRLPRLLQTLDPDAARELMRLVAERFIAAVRSTDRLIRLQLAHEKPATAARLGAHDFAALVPSFGTPAAAARFAQQLHTALDQAFDWREHKLSLGAVCGVALAPRDGKEADAVIRHARMALGAAQGAPSRLKIYTPSIDRAALSRLNLERDMRRAIEQGEFRAFFQPKVNLETGAFEGVEALARWMRADGALVSPGRFVPAAEENGLIEPLSNAILREACWKAAAWARGGSPVSVAVNIPALQLRNKRFAEQVMHVVKQAGLPPNLLELEITETVAMEDPAHAVRVLEPLRAEGVRIAIDDFGCGHSSLALLSQLPVDVIKIDRQFVAALETQDKQAEAIIEMILALAATLGHGVVAEGVERREQAEFLAARGCRWGQGFLYSAAVSADDLAQTWLKPQMRRGEQAA